jgi:hypothetical protein
LGTRHLPRGLFAKKDASLNAQQGCISEASYTFLRASVINDASWRMTPSAYAPYEIYEICDDSGERQIPPPPLRGVGPLCQGGGVRGKPGSE